MVVGRPNEGALVHHLTRQRRRTDLITNEPTVGYVLPIVKLKELASQHAAIEIKIIFIICRELSIRLRCTDAAIRALAE